MSWKTLEAGDTRDIAPQLIQVGDSIWWSTDSYGTTRKMVEYCIKSNKIISVIPFPDNIQPKQHSLCKYKNEIVIVDGKKQQQIITFNPHSKEFEIKFKIPGIGEYATCIAVHDEIHIFGGSALYNRPKAQHFIYRFKQNKIKILNDPAIKVDQTNICVTQYKNKIIRFGGYKSGAYYSKLVISDTTITPNTDNDVKWKTIPVWKCPKPVIRCGYISYKHYVIMFGGSTKRGKMDSIYVLNVLNENKGWIEVKHLKCPKKTHWLAVLDRNNDVHLLSTSERSHFSIAISAILTKDITVNDNEDQKDDIKEENDIKTMQTIHQLEKSLKEKEQEMTSLRASTIKEMKQEPKQPHPEQWNEDEVATWLGT
eukprot:168019_1